ncbi:MAG TPA: pitrilysin family protein [Xanthobacteraceae bacterium]|nr:pitrilysin family protein [Xanthobacteraceae bacterium]
MTVTVEKLKNGITVVTETMPHLKTAALGIWVGAGSRHEAETEHGISHLLEHMAFKGTRRRDARTIAEEIEAVGGDLNASTSVEATAYYARVLGEHVPLGLDILCDILTEPTFDPAELAREQNVIVQEIGAASDTPDDLVFDLFQRQAFPGQPMGLPILGTPASVRSFTPDRLRGYLAARYRGSRMIVAAAGAVDHQAIVAEVTRRLASVQDAAPPPPVAAKYGGGIEMGARELEQVHLVLGLEGRSYHAPEFYALQVFTSLLGGGLSSRLFQEAREKRGLCYSISAFHSPYADVGLFGVYAGTDPADTGELMQVVVDELASAAETASAAEVARAKAQMKVGLVTALESSSMRAEQIARQILAFGRPIPLDELIAKIDAVSVEDARNAGRALVAGGKPTFAGLGPGRGLESAARMAESLGRRAA